MKFLPCIGWAVLLTNVISTQDDIRSRISRSEGIKFEYDPDLLKKKKNNLTVINVGVPYYL